MAFSKPVLQPYAPDAGPCGSTHVVPTLLKQNKTLQEFTPDLESFSNDVESSIHYKMKFDIECNIVIVFFNLCCKVQT